MDQRFGTNQRTNNSLPKEGSHVTLNGLELSTNAINERIEEVDEDIDEDEKSLRDSMGELTAKITISTGELSDNHYRRSFPDN